MILPWPTSRTDFSMARIKFNELAKPTMTPESIAQSRKTAISQIAALEVPKKVGRHKTRAPQFNSTQGSGRGRAQGRDFHQTAINGPKLTQKKANIISPGEKSTN
jgi:hypothetical protein